MIIKYKAFFAQFDKGLKMLGDELVGKTMDQESVDIITQGFRDLMDSNLKAFESQIPIIIEKARLAQELQDKQNFLIALETIEKVPHKEVLLFSLMNQLKEDIRRLEALK